jgi:glycosyltransferase involved in cell wall biosynthesis
MNTTTPRVSVVMPVYNVERYVTQAIQSVLGQSFADFELIIVDDGGADASLDICRSFADPRIRIISQRNRGLAGARNTGIMAARGAYVALLDSDDHWMREKLAVHVAHLDSNPDVGASYAGAMLVDEQDRALGIIQRPKPGRATAGDVFCGRAILNGSMPVFRTAMLREAALESDDGRIWCFDETLRRSEDVECWTRLALRGTLAFEALNCVLTNYRMNADGLSADVIRQLSSWEQVRQRIAAWAPEFVAQYGAEARARELRYLARRCVFMQDRGLALSLMREALAMHPRLLLREPVKTLTTLAACLAVRALPPAGFTWLLQAARPALAGRRT